MALKLMYITNDPMIASIADNCGVDRVFIDLEVRNKEERQKDLDTVKSNHSIEDISRVKNTLNNAELLVRVNSLYHGSRAEIDNVIETGADIVMLPYFKIAEEVREFIKIVGGRAKTNLLLETPEAIDNIEEIVSIDGIDEIHLGLNDLHLGYHLDFMFELLSNGTVEKAVNVIKKRGIPYGFGGIASLNNGLVPAKLIIGEHYRLGSSIVILSRSFCRISSYNIQTDADKIKELFINGVSEIREFENSLKDQDEEYFEKNKEKAYTAIEKAAKELAAQKKRGTKKKT